MYHSIYRIILSVPHVLRKYKILDASTVSAGSYMYGHDVTSLLDPHCISVYSFFEGSIFAFLNGRLTVGVASD